VEHQGIEYEIKRGIGRAEWVWIVHTSPSREGKVHGTRERAIYAAVQAIERWRHRRHDDRETPSR
jgi:hypothetical protein